MKRTFRRRAYKLIATCLLAVLATSCLEIEPVSSVYKFCKKEKFSKPQCACFEEQLSVLSEEDHRIIVQFREQLVKNRKEDKIISRSTGQIYHQIGITDLEHVRYLVETTKDIVRKTRKNCKVGAHDYFLIWR